MINCRVTFTLLFLCLYYIVHMLFAGFDVTNGMCIFDVTQSHILTSDQTMQCVLSVQRSRQFYSSFHRVDISPRSFSVILFIKFMKFMCEQLCVKMMVIIPVLQRTSPSERKQVSL